MAQPWPPWTQTHARHGHGRVEVGVVEHDVGRLAAELEEQRFMVGAPFAMMRCRSAVEPVNEMRSTRGSIDELLADQVVGRRDDVDDARRDVGLLGDEAAEAGGVPRRVGRRLEDHGVAGGQRLAELVRG